MTQSAQAIAGGAFDATRDINFTGQTDFTNITLSTPTSRIGFSAGAGGTVTQLTSKSTAVTLHRPCGQITVNNAALSNGAEVTFTVTNSTCNTGDVVLACHGSAGTSGAYNIECSNVANGAFDVTLSNLSAGSLSEAIVVNFIVLKGSAT